MGFYNKAGAQRDPVPVVTYLPPGAGAQSQPLDVVPYGGLLVATASVANGATVQLIAAPGGAFAYRLHSYGFVLAQGVATYQGRYAQLSEGGRVVHSDEAVLPVATGTIAGGFMVDGALATGAVSVTQVSSTTAVTMFVRYDSIVRPTVQ